jgi:hypothetical protein
MSSWRIVGLAAVLAGLSAPASAQFYLKSHQFADGPTTGAEAGMTVPMPEATPIEQKAGLAWTLRSALNVAALQCQFEPLLNSVETYNAILKDHDAEFDKDQAILQKYYARMPGAGRATAGKGSKPGQAGFDQFGTRTYSAFSAVSSQYGFCQTAAGIAREAMFAPRGTFGDLAEKRMRLLRNSLNGSWGEEALPRAVQYYQPTPPRLDPACVDKKGRWIDKKCGTIAWPPAPMP